MVVTASRSSTLSDGLPPKDDNFTGRHATRREAAQRAWAGVADEQPARLLRGDLRELEIQEPSSCGRRAPPRRGAPPPRPPVASEEEEEEEHGDDNTEEAGEGRSRSRSLGAGVGAGAGVAVVRDM